MEIGSTRETLGHLENFSGCHVAISDKDTKTQLLDTTIIQHNPYYQTIRIPYPNKEILAGEDQVSLVIFAKERRLHYLGTIHRSHNAVGTLEIALYRGETRESRRHLRHKLTASGHITELMIAQTPIKLRRPIETYSVNVSGGGILIQTLPETLVVGMMLRLVLQVDGKAVDIYCRVARRRPIDVYREEYGCTFV